MLQNGIVVSVRNSGLLPLVAYDRNSQRLEEKLPTDRKVSDVAQGLG
jgi:hypothetical protein